MQAVVIVIADYRPAQAVYVSAVSYMYMLGAGRAPRATAW